MSDGILSADTRGAKAGRAMSPAPARDRAFFRTTITAMAVVIVAGFVLQLAMGRSSFGAPLVVHLHAVVFMGWVAILVAQAWLAAGGGMKLHRTLGAVAVIWLLAMLVLGPLVTVEAARTGRVPFFFQPQHFILANTLTLLGVVGLVVAAVALRKNRDWHPRLQIGAFTLLMGPGFGRILPMPFLKPYAFEIATGVAVIVPLIGMVRDWRVRGRPHPAWLWAIAVLAGTLILARVLAFTPAGAAIFAAVTAGSPAAHTDGLIYPKPPF
ncbi:MAG: hypothetical protein ACOVOE_10905 [Caulobacter sp.]